MRWLLFKIEMAVWLMRLPGSFMLAFVPMAGYLTAGADEPARFAAFALGVSLFAGPLLIINDVVDYEKDRVTAPYRPLAAGYLSRTAAVAIFFVLMTIALASLWAAVGDTARLVGILAAVVVAVAVVVVLYSKTKHLGFVASVVLAVGFCLVTVFGWYVGGPEPGVSDKALLPLATVLVWTFLQAINNNTGVALIDIARDPLVGNRTLPVRIGAEAAFRVLAWGTIAEIGVIAFAAGAIDRGDAGRWIALLLLAVLAVGTRRAFRSARPVLADASREQRQERTASWAPISRRFVDRELVLLVALEPTVGAVTAPIAKAVYVGGNLWYRRRIEPLRARTVAPPISDLTPS